MLLFSGVILILCTIALLVFAVSSHQKVSNDNPFDDSERQIDFDDFYNKLRKFVSNEQEKIYAVLGISNAYNLLASGIQKKGFCILTDKAAYFIGKVYQKKWIFAFGTNVQHRIIASELKGINVGTVSRFWMLLCGILSIGIEVFNIRFIWGVFMLGGDRLSSIITPGIVGLLLVEILATIIIVPYLVIYFVLHAFFLKRTNICIEFTSLTVAFMASELGKQEIKNFYKAVSDVQELYINNLIPAEHTKNMGNQRQMIYSDKATSLVELSKLFESGMITKEEFEQLKQEIIGGQ